MVSRASLYAMDNLERKSARDCPPMASSTFAPMLVPHLKICFERMNSFFFRGQMLIEPHNAHGKGIAFGLNNVVSLHFFNYELRIVDYRLIVVSCDS